MSMKIHVAVLCAFLGLIQCFVLNKHECTTDADCAGGCCYTDRLHGSVCHMFGNQSSGCHLPNHNHTIMLYPCGCQQGLTCKELHFATGTDTTDPLHKAEALLLGHGYGICSA